MEPISAAASILGVIGAIASVTSAATTFMRDVRSARKQIVAVKKELAALKAILEILADDFQDPANARGSYPDGVVERIVDIGKNCQEVVNDIGECVGLGADREGEESRVVWAATGRAKVERLRGELEAHKSTLSVTLDLVSVIVLRDIKNDTDQLTQDTSAILQDTSQIQNDINRILTEISRLQAQLPLINGARNPQSSYALERFLEDLKSDAETVQGETEDLAGSGDSTPRRVNTNVGVSEPQGVVPLIQVPESAKRRPSSVFGGLSLRGFFTGHGRSAHSRVGSDAGDGDSVSEGSAATEIAPRKKRGQSGSGMERAGRNQAPQKEDLAPIILINHQGNRYAIPYEVGKKWKDMETVIEQSYNGFTWNPAREGYDLVGPKGHIILPVAWEGLVKPGLEVKLKRWGYGD